ncbi:MAG: PAS domain S-box protein [Planctomycetaceae bacterium]|nr:PAS domain S-box protein [Planctomycetaceae bacterium]
MQNDKGHMEQSSDRFLAGGGEMGERTRTYDWSQTPAGPIESWPQGLKTAVRIMLGSRYAMWLGWGPDFTFFYNDAYAKMTLGPKHPWALGRPAREVWPEIWDDVGPRAEAVISTGEATWDEGLLLFLERRGYSEETYHTFSYSPLPDDSEGIGGMLCVVTEETERTIGERRLRTLRELAARTTDEVTSVDIACQTSAEILAGNPQDLPFTLLYLLDAEQQRARRVGLTGVDRSMPTSPDVVDLSSQDAPWPFREVIESGQGIEVDDLPGKFGHLSVGAWPESPQQAVVLPLAKPGQTQLAGFVVAGVSPRRPFDDDYRGFLDLMAGQIATAVTNARVYEEEKKRAEALAELDLAKTAFFSNVSHEFRTPLTLMLGPVEDLLSRSDTELSTAARTQLEVVNRNGQRLLRLVNSLLDFSRIEAGRVRAAYQPTDLSAFTLDLASVFRAACERAGLQLIVNCSALSEPAYVDRDMWEKIVLNLLSNAFKFTSEGEIAVTLQQQGQSAELRVRDTGTGIPAEEMPRLFERFHRIENAQGRTHEGSGIGLALVQELVRLHGGAITAESVMGQGTTFLVSIPLGLSHLPADQIEDSRSLSSTTTGAMPYVEEALRWLPDVLEQEAPAELTRLREVQPDRGDRSATQQQDVHSRVLVADDNSDMRQYITRLLAEQYHVAAVPDGRAALESARENPPDLILSDVMMPHLDGFGLLLELRADPRTREIPVIMLSARAGEESRVEGMEAGADDYLVKPFSARELLARVKAHLQMALLRKESEQAIRDSEERLRMALAAARMVAWQLDLSSGEVKVSSSAAEVLGLPPGSSLDHSDDGFALLHPDDRERHRAVVQKAAEECGSYLSQYRVIRPVDGKVIWLEERGHGAADDSGQTARLVGVVLDITERKRAELALQKERDLLSVTLASIGDGVITTDAEGRVTNLNGVAEALTGWSTQDAVGQPLEVVFRIVNEDSRQTVDNPATRALRDGVVVGLANHTILIRKDGTECPIDDSAAPIQGEQGEVIGCVLVFRDIAERRKAEAALRESEAHFRNMADNAPSMIWVTNPESSCTYISRQWCEYTGTTPEQNLGTGWFNCVHPDDRRQTADAFLKANEKKASFSIDYRLKRHDGEYRWAADVGLPRFDEQQQFQGYVGTVFEIHDRKLAAEALRQAAADLSEANRRKTQFLATLGHELRNPLAPIRTGLELMKMVANDPVQMEETRSMMERQTRQMVRLIDDLLDVARITQGKLQLRTRRVTVAEVVQHAVEASQPFINEAGHELTVRLPEQPVYLTADPSRLAQVFSNLLINSTKYTPRGGRIEFTAEHQGSNVLVKVKDNGIGIPAEMQFGIFEMFTQIDRPLEKGYKGLGIGLTLVKQLVEMHEGRIEVHSDGEGQGSEFSVQLPVQAAEPAFPEQEGQTEPDGTTSRHRILVVDDNRAAADMLSMVVRMLGNEVRTSYDGEQAIRAAAEFTPDLILMDLGMPRMNGYEAARHIREQPWGEPMMLVALTGWGQDEDRQRTREAGFDHHLVKPAEPAELKKLFQDLRQKKQQ